MSLPGALSGHRVRGRQCPFLGVKRTRNDRFGSLWRYRTTAGNSHLADPVAAIVFCAPTGARHTVVGGRLIVEDGEIATIDMAPVIRDHNRNAARLAALDA